MILSDALVAYVTGNFPYSVEFQTFTMAFQGAMIVRNGPNKNGTMHWFHAFLQSVVVAFAGALFTPFWLGRASTVFSNDLNMAMCIISFILVNYLPGNIGFKIGNWAPIQIITTAGAQMFRALGSIKFIHIAYDTFKDSASSYYPTPVFGPIIFGAILGNMGGFFWGGFHGYLEKGMPYGFQNGLFFASFYHFCVNDRHGFIGRHLRLLISIIPATSFLKLSESSFPVFLVSGLMQAIAILQMPIFLGPSFSPFILLLGAFTSRKGQKTLISLEQPVAITVPIENKKLPAGNTSVQENGKRTVAFQETKVEIAPKKNKKKKSA